MSIQSTLLSLPDEILTDEVISRYSVHQLLNLFQVNKRFNTICRSDQLWQYFTKRDFNIIHQELNNWRDAYIFYNTLFTDPLAAIPYVEDALLQKRNNTAINSFYQKLIDNYHPAIEHAYFRGVDGSILRNEYIHKLALYIPTTGTFLPRTSLNQIRVLEVINDFWNDITEAQAIRLNICEILEGKYFHSLG